MSAGGVGNLVFVETTMDKYHYLNILRENLEASATKLGMLGYFRLVHDNHPKHKPKCQWLSENVKVVLAHPPQSPEINPIEDLWGVF